MITMLLSKVFSSTLIITLTTTSRFTSAFHKSVPCNSFIKFQNSRFRILHSKSLDEADSRSSVTGVIYSAFDDNSNELYPTVTLYTKSGCTLCDKVSEVLKATKQSHPHSLYAIDITDEDNKNWFAKYKYDIPVLHIDNMYWAKHRLSTEEAIKGLEAAKNGDFVPQQGDPDAAAMER